MPEMPEVQAHAERLTESFAGRRLKAFRPLTFTALKTVSPAPESAYGVALDHVGRRGKFLLVTFPPVTFVTHLMQGGRLLVDTKHSAKPRGGQARFVFERRPDDDADPPGLLLTEQGTERRAGVWCVPTDTALATAPLDTLGPEAYTIESGVISATALAERFAKVSNTRIHGFLRDQHAIAGLGRRLANEVCHRAQISPFAMTRKLGGDVAAAVVRAIDDAVVEGLAEERARDDMSSSKERTSRVHGRTGEPCPVCGDTVRAVEYASYTVNYCPTCQTGGKLLADNVTSKFLK
jgi:formamidopyrimidine-DNA glycosylase